MFEEGDFISLTTTLSIYTIIIYRKGINNDVMFNKGCKN